MIRSTTVVGEKAHFMDASSSLRMLTACVCILSLAAQLSFAAESLTLRQFDASRSPLIDIVAQVGTWLATDQAEVLEFKLDQCTPVGKTKRVDLVPVSSLLTAKDYTYRRPVCNVFFTFAGTYSHIAEVADSLDFAVAFKAAFANVQLGAVQLYVYDPVQGKMLDYATPERVEEAMVTQAKAFAALQPEGIWNKVVSLFKREKWLPIDQVAEKVRAFVAAKDSAAKNAVAHTIVVFWAGGPEDDVKRVWSNKRAFLQDNVIVTIGEIVGSSEFAVERARTFCLETSGAFLSKRDLRLPKGKIDYARVISAALDAWKKRVSDRFLLSAQSENLENTSNCWFEVGIPGTSVRQKVSCSRDASAVNRMREEHRRSLQSQFEDWIKKGEFRSAFELIRELRELERDTASLESSLTGAWKKHILALADKGEYAAAMQEVNALHGTKLITQKEQVSLRQDVENRKREKHRESLQSQFEDRIKKDEFRSAFELIRELRELGMDTASLESSLTGAWKKHILALADKGEYAAAMQEVNALDGTKLITQKEQVSLQEEVLFRSGQWAAEQAKDQYKAMDLLMRWRNLAKQSGSYEKQRARAAGVALQMARYLATDVDKDADFAREINELRKIDDDQSRGESCIRLLRGWITRNGERFDVSARLALLEDWGLVLPALSSKMGDSEAIRRFFVLATSDKQANDILAELRAESLSKNAPVDGYVSLNRALKLAHPLVIALKSAADLAADLEGDSTHIADIAELLKRALTGFNDREATFYRLSDGFAGQYLLADDPVRIVSTRMDDYGYGIRLHPSFNRRLHKAIHEARGTAVLEGIEGKRPVYVVLLPVGAESFIRIAFSDRTAPAVLTEFITAKEQALKAGKEKEAMNIALSVLDVRDAELVAHLGAEFFGQLIPHVGIDAFVRRGGRGYLRDFHAAIPKGMQGFVILDRLALRDGDLVCEADQSAQYPDPLPKDVNLVDRRIFGAAYAIWKEPYFEIGIPLRDKRDEGERRVLSGILRVGLRSIPR